MKEPLWWWPGLIDKPVPTRCNELYISLSRYTFTAIGQKLIHLGPIFFHTEQVRACIRSNGSRNIPFLLWRFVPFSIVIVSSTQGFVLFSLVSRFDTLPCSTGKTPSILCWFSPDTRHLKVFNLFIRGGGNGRNKLFTEVFIRLQANSENVSPCTRTLISEARSFKAFFFATAW
jgi:hypothetical protein